MRAFAFAFVPLAAMLIGCQTAPVPPSETKAEVPIEDPSSTVSKTDVPQFGPFTR